MKNVEDFAGSFTDAIYSFIKYNILITNEEKIIAASGPLKKKLLNKEISDSLITCINRKENIHEKYRKNLELTSKESFEVIEAHPDGGVGEDLVTGHEVLECDQNAIDRQVVEQKYHDHRRQNHDQKRIVFSQLFQLPAYFGLGFPLFAPDRCRRVRNSFFDVHLFPPFCFFVDSAGFRRGKSHKIPQFQH